MLDPKKYVRASFQCPFLGVITDLSTYCNGYVVVRVLKERSDRLRSLIRAG